MRPLGALFLGALLHTGEALPKAPAPLLTSSPCSPWSSRSLCGQEEEEEEEEEVISDGHCPLHPHHAAAAAIAAAAAAIAVIAAATAVQLLLWPRPLPLPLQSGMRAERWLLLLGGTMGLCDVMAKLSGGSSQSICGGQHVPRGAWSRGWDTAHEQLSPQLCPVLQALSRGQRGAHSPPEPQETTAKGDLTSSGEKQQLMRLRSE